MRRALLQEKSPRAPREAAVRKRQLARLLWRRGCESEGDPKGFLVELSALPPRLENWNEFP